MEDSNLIQCATYEDYLDAFVRLKDIYYFRSIDPCRMMVASGHRTWSTIYTPEEFEERKNALSSSVWPNSVKSPALFSSKLTIKDPVLLALAEREPLNNNKIISTIIYVKTVSSKGFHKSGYIDMQTSLQNARTDRDLHNWQGIFAGTAKLHALRTDLSFIDWKSKKVYTNDSDNYKVLHGNCTNLAFMHRGDRKIIQVTESTPRHCNYKRTMVTSKIYGSYVFYDHRIRRRN